MLVQACLFIHLLFCIFFQSTVLTPFFSSKFQRIRASVMNWSFPTSSMIVCGFITDSLHPKKGLCFPRTAGNEPQTCIYASNLCTTIMSSRSTANEKKKNRVISESDWSQNRVPRRFHKYLRARTLQYR
ncbi:hypothetical protein PUN28_012786 [Cardiocondyla obscurior]|uniref:Secreted protein n=1 Tax=Cardiocondyla obscurior TaxID=286306 RepID=A0AAW2F7X0_9HYME